MKLEDYKIKLKDINDQDIGHSSEIFDRLLSRRFSNNVDKKVDSVVSEKKVLKPSERMLQEIAKHGFVMDQLEEVLKVRGSQLIISSAGSGKTTALIFKIIYDLQTGETTRVVNINSNNIRVPEKIWVSTFLKTGACGYFESNIF